MRKWITCYLVLAMVVIGIVPPVKLHSYLLRP